MKPRITLITICVDDLERSLKFYRDGMGLKTDGIIGKEFEHGAVAFFELQAGLKLAIWPRKSLAHDSGLALGKPSATEMSLGHNVASKAEVDAVMAHLDGVLRADLDAGVALPALLGLLVEGFHGMTGDGAVLIQQHKVMGADIHASSLVLALASVALVGAHVGWHQHSSTSVD